jgi:hypothetical protein
MYKNNLIYYPIDVNNKLYYGFIDTGGGDTFLFREKNLVKYIKNTDKYIDHKELQEQFPNSVILFIGQNFFTKKIVKFDYINRVFSEIKILPKLNKYRIYQMIKSKYTNFIHIDIIFEGIEQRFLFDTGASLSRNSKNYAISFLNGLLFDKLAKKYKVVKNYDDDGSPVIIIPEIVIFDTIIKNVKFLRRDNNAFKWMSNITKIDHIGAIGGNVFKKFDIICDYKNINYYVK